MSRRKRTGSGHPKKSSGKVFPQVIGKVQMTREGFAFIISEDSDDDVFVKASKTRGALHGDTVRVSVTREKSDGHRREGQVVEIIERSVKPFIGILHVVNDQAWVLMESRFMPHDICIPVAEPDSVRYRRNRAKTGLQTRNEEGWLKPAGDGAFVVCGLFETAEDGTRREMTAYSGMKVAAVVDKWEKHESNPTGHIVDVLGEPGDNDTEMHAILAEYSLPYRFEQQVADAADAISVYNVLAYAAKVRKFYIKKENDIIEAPVGKIVQGEGEIIDERIYISRGGIINGDYIRFCYLKHQTGNYSIKDSIKIPVSSIEEENDVNFILFVDHREPKLKALMEFYNVTIEHDCNIKYNVRTFKKLK